MRSRACSQGPRGHTNQRPRPDGPTRVDAAARGPTGPPGLVQSAATHGRRQQADIVFDEIGLENAIAENPELLEPLPDKVLRKLQGRKGARSKGSTRN